MFINMNMKEHNEKRRRKSLHDIEQEPGEILLDSRGEDDTKSMDKNPEAEKSQHFVNPTDSDILGGRGNGVNSHPGNAYFRRLIKENKVAYVHAKGTFVKRNIVQEIFQKTQSEGGRFLKVDPETEHWYCMSIEEAEKKIGQALREGGPSMREKKNKHMNSKMVSQTPTALVEKKEDDTLSLRSDNERDHLLLGGGIGSDTINHKTINDENVNILSKQINLLRRKMNMMKYEYNRYAEKHRELMTNFFHEIDPLPLPPSHSHTKKRRLSESESDDSIETTSYNGAKHRKFDHQVKDNQQVQKTSVL